MFIMSFINTWIMMKLTRHFSTDKTFTNMTKGYNTFLHFSSQRNVYEYEKENNLKLTQTEKCCEGQAKQIQVTHTLQLIKQLSKRLRMQRKAERVKCKQSSTLSQAVNNCLSSTRSCTIVSIIPKRIALITITDVSLTSSTQPHQNQRAQTTITQ